MIEVSALVDTVGASVLQLLVSGSDARVHLFTLAEPDLGIVGSPGDLVLGVMIPDVPSALVLLEGCAQTGAAGIVLKAPIAVDGQVIAAAERLGLALVELAPHLSWAHFVWLLRGVIDQAGAPGAPLVGDAGVRGDLFALADVAAGIVDGSITIEDPQSRVLAYSACQDLSDSARVSTIMGRGTPEALVSRLRARGIFRKLARSSDQIYLPEGPDWGLPRLIIPVHAGKEWLGSIWAVVTGPAPEEQVHALKKLASVMAMHLLRLRAHADAAQRMSADRLRVVLTGDSPEAEAVADVCLPDGPWRVVSLGAPRGAADLREELDLWESITGRFGWQHSLLTCLDGMPFAVVTSDGPDTTAGSWAWLVALIKQIHPKDAAVYAAAGGVATSASELARSRSEAVELRLLIADGRLRGPVCRLEDAWDTVTLARALTATRVESGLLGGPLPAILAYDAANGTDCHRTLAMYLNHFGEPQAAAKALHIHPNTLRYRMRRLAEVTPIDFSSPQVRLALTLQLAALA